MTPITLLRGQFSMPFDNMKDDRVPARNHLAGSQGNTINAIFGAACQNFPLLLACFRELLALIILIALYGYRWSREWHRAAV